MNIPNLVAEADNVLVPRCFINSFRNVSIKCRSFAEDIVEGKATDFGAHGCLCEVGDGVFSVFDPVTDFSLALITRRKMNTDLAL